jgi:SAM-dependent methyltransferase
MTDLRPSSFRPGPFHAIRRFVRSPRDGGRGDGSSATSLLESWPYIRKALDARTIRRSRAFDATWYLDRYADVRAAGTDPFQHFVDCGHIEGRDPNPIFDTRWYLSEYRAAIGRGCNPLADYLRHSSSGARRPNRWLDPAWYRSRYGGVCRGVDPMVHYLEEGAARGLDPSPNFATRAFESTYPGDGQFRNPLANFLHRYLVRGCIDTCTSLYLAGWAGRHIGPTIELEVVVNGIARGRLTPWIPRPDVRASLHLEAKGFYFVFSERLRPGDVIELRDEFGRDACDAPKAYSILPLGASGDHQATRASIAAAFLRGKGVEIGALTQPTDLPPECHVVYYDRFPSSVLRTFFDHASEGPLFEPDVLGNAETLDGLGDTTFDFVVANHVIEHLEDPIAFLASVASHLEVGGRAMIAAPDKRYTFDRARPVTRFEHLVDDHVGGAERSRADHFREYARLTEGVADPELDRRIAELDRADMHPIHFHVWDADAFVAFAEAAIERFALPFSLVYATAANTETIIVLEKSAPAADHERARASIRSDVLRLSS